MHAGESGVDPLDGSGCAGGVSQTSGTSIGYAKSPSDECHQKAVDTHARVPTLTHWVVPECRLHRIAGRPMDMVGPGTSAIAGHAGGQTQLHMHSHSQTTDKNISGIAAAAGWADCSSSPAAVQVHADHGQGGS